MDPMQQQSHLKSQGRIVDDAPIVDPFADIRHMDGRERLKAYEARKKAIEFDAETAAMREAAEQS
jgi:hypothetical protein